MGDFASSLQEARNGSNGHIVIGAKHGGKGLIRLSQQLFCTRVSGGKGEQAFHQVVRLDLNTMPRQLRLEATHTVAVVLGVMQTLDHCDFTVSLGQQCHSSQPTCMLMIDAERLFPQRQAVAGQQSDARKAEVQSGKIRLQQVIAQDADAVALALNQELHAS